MEPTLSMEMFPGQWLLSYVRTLRFPAFILYQVVSYCVKYYCYVLDLILALDQAVVGGCYYCRHRLNAACGDYIGHRTAMP